MTCRGLWVSHICSETQCFFLFLNGLTLNPISPHILKQRWFLFHELCRVRAFMFIPAHGTHHSFILSWSAKGRKMQKKKARNQVCIGFEDLVGTSFHVEGLRVSKITASTFTGWRVPAISFPSILNFPLPAVWVFPAWNGRQLAWMRCMSFQCKLLMLCA